MFEKKVKTVVTIEGMMCDHCKSMVEKSLLELDGVSKVRVNLKDKNAFVYSKNGIDPKEIIKIIDGLGYQVIHIRDGK
mgnify:CR=1 FL=1